MSGARQRPRRRRDEPVRIAVVGVGGMGRNHARVLAQMKGVDLVAVVDPDLDRAAEVGRAFDCVAVTDIRDLPGVDAATVAAPSILHADIGTALLERGIHCMVEKPIATSPEHVARLIDAAERSRSHLQIGHIERFNPAVRQLQEILAGEPVQVVNTRRMSAVSSRIQDVDVVSDLMVHDLDIVLYLMGDDIREVVARGIAGPHGTDHVTALITFGDGRLASLTASRITQNQIRELEVTTPQRFFTVDYPNQELLIYRQGRIGGVAGGDFAEGRYVLDVGTERVFVRRLEPLVEELAHFVGVVRGQHPPEVGGAQGKAAMELVWAIQAQLHDLNVGV